MEVDLPARKLQERDEVLDHVEQAHGVAERVDRRLQRDDARRDEMRV